MVGNSLSHYKIVEELGRGGMGIVYRAADTKLNRDVALKILPAAALASEDDRSRFFREAQSAAQLHHPNIATVFEIDEAILKDGDGNEINATDGPRPYIVMELIEGDTLQEVIKKAPMKLADAVKVASQVAEALKAAHAKDIVHRDIKSANVMITNDGIAKVLDFGLAKTNQSTMLTRMGSTLGTVAYMSPEQARGQEVDGRSDLYSLGTMLYEMVAGKLPYDGEYEQAVVYSILNEPPEPLTAVRTGVPMQLEWIVDKLLAKEADYRYQSAAGLLADLKTLDLSGSGQTRRSMPAMSGATGTALSSGVAAGISRKTWVVAGTVLLVGLVVGWLVKPSPEIPEEPIRKFRLPVPQMTFVSEPIGSPDGRYWAFTGIDSSSTRAAYLWDVSNFSFQKVVDSDGLAVESFSPDGNWLALRGNGGTHRARVPSGSAIAVDSLSDAVWMDEERLIAMDDDAFEFWEISPESGDRMQLEMAALDTSYTELDYPHRITGYPIILFTAEKVNPYADVLAFNYETGDVDILIRAACCAQYHDSGTLIYLTALSGFTGKLVAQRFDAGSLFLSGIPVDLTTEPVRRNAFGLGGDDSFLMNADPAARASIDMLRISRLDPDSRRADFIDLAPSYYDRFSFSPDGKEIAIERAGSGEPTAPSNIFVINLETKTERQLTYTIPTNRVPVWTRSGKIYFVGGGFENASVYVKNADGSGAEQLVTDDADFPFVSDDEHWLAYVNNEGMSDLWALNLESGERVALDTTSTLRAGDPAISPDGRFIAYTMASQSGNLVGRSQRLYVRSFPDPSRYFLQVVQERADDPFWSEDGQYLYYRNNGVIFRIGVNTEQGFTLTSSPEEIITFPAPTIRYDQEPGTGNFMVVHPGTPRGTSSEVRSNLDVTLSFSRYLDELLGNDR